MNTLAWPPLFPCAKQTPSWGYMIRARCASSRRFGNVREFREVSWCAGLFLQTPHKNGQPLPGEKGANRIFAVRSRVERFVSPQRELPDSRPDRRPSNVLIRDGVSRTLIICSQHLRGDRQVWHRRHRILDGYLPGLNDCCKVLRWSADGNDANQLFINKLLYAKTGEFTPVAGVLDAAKW